MNFFKKKNDDVPDTISIARLQLKKQQLKTNILHAEIFIQGLQGHGAIVHNLAEVKKAIEAIEDAQFHIPRIEEQIKVEQKHFKESQNNIS